LNDGDKQRADPSDWFNFGFDEEKWTKFLNKSILMHYEKNLLNNLGGGDVNKPMQPIMNMPNPFMGVRPMMMPPQNPYGYMRPPFGYPMPFANMPGNPMMSNMLDNKNK
jgi:hypothetical protein